MVGVQGHALAAGVCEAGGLGSIAAAGYTLDALTQIVGALRASTGAAFNVNFFCHTEPVPDEAAEQGWRAALDRYYNEYGIDPATVPAGAGRAPFSEASLAWVEMHRPPVVSFHFGLPKAEHVQRLKATGAVLMSSATTVQEGLWLQAHGADVVIAQGLEAGGHRGIFLSDDLSTQMPTLELVRGLASAVALPIIAAGGIHDADGVRAAMQAGATGAQVGTAFLYCPESGISALHRAALAREQGQHTTLTRLFTGRPARGIVNRLMAEVGPMSPVAPAFPLATAALQPLRAQAEKVGCTDFTPLWSGTSPGPDHGMDSAAFTRFLSKGFVD